MNDWILSPACLLCCAGNNVKPFFAEGLVSTSSRRMEELEEAAVHPDAAGAEGDAGEAMPTVHPKQFINVLCSVWAGLADCLRVEVFLSLVLPLNWPS